MGGNKAANRQNAANAQQSAENRKRELSTLQRNRKSMRSTLAKTYDSERDIYVGKRMQEARSKIAKERSDAIEKYGDLRQGYQDQQRRQFLKSKRGVGQLGAEDFAVTKEELDKYKEISGRKGSRWEAMMEDAALGIKDQANEEYLNKAGDLESYIGGNSDYQGINKRISELSNASSKTGWRIGQLNTIRNGRTGW